jgi:hypothetical protein
MESPTYFCQNPNCPNHKASPDDHSWYRRNGAYHTQAFDRVQRFICNDCGKTFSTQTFSLNYFLKKKTDFKAFARELNSTNSSCFSGRHTHLSADSVRIRCDRLGRNALYLHSAMIGKKEFTESLCADGFESYTRSKYYPNNLNLLVGQDSEFIYYFTHSFSRRKGKVTPKQKERMEYEYTNKSFDECKLDVQFTDIITFLDARQDTGQIILHTDEHKTYDYVIRQYNASLPPGKAPINHIRTNSMEPRTAWNPLFAVNYVDFLLRKDCPMYRRKTVCFSRNPDNALLRDAIYMMLHNYFKPKRILSRANQIAEKHYSDLGLDDEKLQSLKARVFTDRFFLSKITLPSFFDKVWKKMTDHPFTNCRSDVPHFALT